MLSKVEVQSLLLVYAAKHTAKSWSWIQSQMEENTYDFVCLFSLPVS